MKKLLSISILTLALTVFANGQGLANLSLRFHHTINGQSLILDSLRYGNASNEQFSVSRVSYLLSGFVLETRSGDQHALEDQYAWIDLAQRRTTITLQNIPTGIYHRLRFSIGLPKQVNHAPVASFPSRHPLNPNVNGLHWDWQGGFVFLAFEGTWRSDQGAISGFSFHLARDPNRTQLTLGGKLDLNQNMTADIEFEIGHLINGASDISFYENGSSTHSHPDDPIAAALVTNLTEAFRLSNVSVSKPHIGRTSPTKPLYLPQTFTPFPFKTSRSFPLPDLPRDNPLLVERVELGRRLFNEQALSRGNDLSCASCHRYENAFSDPRRVSVGFESRQGLRNSMPLFNLAWKSSFFWDGRAPTLRHQVLMPIQDHAEMNESLENVVMKLSQIPDYPQGFAAAFDSDEITSERIALALENFLLTQTSFQSKFDRARRGEAHFSELEQRGFDLFMTEYEPRSGRYGADCFHCHGGPLFTDHQFKNNGLDSDSPEDWGRFTVTKDQRDYGRFATPSLRNIALTSPYMHDGRFKTLEEVVDHYSDGVKRSETLDANLAKHPSTGLNLSVEDRRALVAFMKTLTDEQYSAQARPEF